MFGFKLQSGSCGCGCGSTACNQQKIFGAEVLGASACGDLANAVAYVNANFSSVSPLTEAWAAHPAGWQYAYSVEFDAPSDSTPDSLYTETGDGTIPSGSEYPNSSIYAMTGGEPGGVTRIAFLLPDSSVQIVGSWQNEEGCSLVFQQSCVMTGVATGCGYVFDIPIPDPSLCLSGCLPTSGASYTVYPDSKYGGLFEDYLWSDFVAYCTANPSVCGSLTSPGACMNGDPFFGDEP